MSVTSGFKCVDFRTFFMPYGGVEPKPSKKGIALRIPEWIELLRLIEVINNTCPDLATALPCYTELDHASQLFVGTEVFRMLPVRRYRYYLTRV